MKKIFFILFILLNLNTLKLANSQDTSQLKKMIDSLSLVSNSDYELTEELALKLEMQSTKANYKPGLSAAFNTLGAIYDKTGEKEKALKYLKKSIELKKEIGDPIKLGMGYENLGVFYMGNGDIANSKKYLEKAIAIYTQNEDQLNLAIGLLNYGAMWLTFEQPDSALIYLLQSDKLFQNYDDDRHLICINLLGYCYGDLDQKDSAYFYMNYTLKEYEKNGDLAGIKNSSNNLAAEYLDDGKYRLAIKYAQKSLEVPLDVGGYSEHIKSTTTMARAFMALNQNDSALKYYGKAEVLTSEYYDTEKLHSIQELQTQYETEKKEIEIKTLNMERQIQQANINILLLLSSGLGLLLLIGIGLFIIIRQRQRTKILLKEQEVNALIREQELRSMNAMLEGQESERKRIARDLHDRLGGLLATIKLHFGAIEEQLQELGMHAQQQYSKTSEMLDEAVNEVRRISHNMVSGVLLQFGLISALKELMNSIDANSRIHTQLQVIGMEERLPLQQELATYRMIQELVSNILKHANASEIKVQLKRSGQLIQLKVNDNGRGFDIQSVKKGMGLENLKIRSQQLSGEYQMNSEVGKGTEFICKFPIQKTEEL